MILHLITLGDRRDERRARALRARFGRDRWLVSWSRLGRGRWLARLSCPELADTVEAFGGSRCRAIALAESALRAAIRQRDAEDQALDPEIDA